MPTESVQTRASDVIEVPVVVRVSRQSLVDALVTAFEDGPHWVDEVRPIDRHVPDRADESRATMLARHVLDGVGVQLYLTVERRWCPLQRDQLIRGIAAWFKAGGSVVGRLLDLGAEEATVDFDALDPSDVDAIIQLALFGEVIHG